MCTSFKLEILDGIHALGTTVTRAGTGADTIKAALYLATATVNANTTAYSATNEVSGTNYTAGGVTVTNATAPTSTNVSASTGQAYWTPSANIAWTTVTLSTAFDTVLLYNNTQSNKAISVHTFSSQTVTAGNFTLTMPSNTNTTALIRIA
jgi:hypothetical protein